MNRPKRTCKKPVKYCDEQTQDKENIEPEEDVKKKASSMTSVADKTPISKLIKKCSKKKPKTVETGSGGQKVSKNLAIQVVQTDDEIIDVTSVEGLGKENISFSNKIIPEIQPIVRNTSGKYEAQYSSTSRAACRKCKQKIMKDMLRIGKEVSFDTGNYAGSGMGWWHMHCFFQQHSHLMKWKDFNGVEDFSIEEQKELYQHACHSVIPDNLLAEMTVTQDLVCSQNKLKEEQLKIYCQEASIKKQEEITSRITDVKNSSIEKVIRENIAKVIEKKTVEELKNIINGSRIIVERSTVGKGKKKGAPKKADYVQAIINANPLCNIGSLVRRAIRKHIKVDELKVMLKKAGLPCTGSKLELTNRLLDHLGGDFGEESVEEKKPKNRYGSNFDSDDYKFTKYDVYEKDESHPEIVVKARNGDLDCIKNILQKTAQPVATINSSRKWTETEEKWGYDKSWEWHDETPLLAASRNRYVDIVHYLLTMKADPTLEGCIACDTTESPIKAVEKEIASIHKQINVIKGDNECSSFSVFAYNATTIARNLAKYELIKKLLIAANAFWIPANYAGPQYSDARKKAFSKNPNKPTNSEQLKAVLADIPTDIIVDTILLEDLESCLKNSRRKEGEKRAVDFQRKQDEIERQRQEIERQHEQREKDKERIAIEFREKVKAVAVESAQPPTTYGNIPTSNHVNQNLISDPNYAHMPAYSGAFNEMNLAGNGIMYKGIIVNWCGGYGFLKVDSLNISSNLFLHVTDITSQEDRRICGTGTQLKFMIVASVRKPGTMQAKSASILT